MSSYKDVDVECPYFININKRDIRCEGIHANSTMVTHFNRSEDQERYLEGFCNHFPNDCLISRAIDKKYENRNN